MDLIRRFSSWLSVLIIERRMWWRFIRNRGKYEKTRQWLNLDGPDDALARGYQEAAQFIRHTVNLSRRPNGIGVYAVKVAVIWLNPDRGDSWQIDFQYQERETAYTEIMRRLESYDPPPATMMVGILPYGDLTEGL